MQRPLPVRFNARALREIAAVGDWWREHRETSGIIGDQVTWITGLLALNPYMGRAVPNARRRTLRRVYLDRIHYHLYYQVDQQRERIVVVSLWYASRRPPRF